MSDRLRERMSVGRARLWLGTLLLGAAALTTSPAFAEACSEFGGVLDGFAGDVAPSQIQIDQNCTIRNFPDGITTNFSFFTQPGQTDDRWLIIFDNVVHLGNMSCNAVLDHRIWFTNGSSTKIQEGCQNLLIPVEKIDKQTPPGVTGAAIGVPFTYTLTSPVLFDPATGTVINAAGSDNDLHSIVLTDDLNETGVDLTLVGYTAYWRASGVAVPLTFSNTGGLLTFSDFPIIPAGEQINIELTVVLEDTPTNAPGTTFINTARWQFGRLIDDVFYEPLPGENGISPPLTISGPDLVVTKTGPATLGRTLNLGEWGDFAIDVHNTGLTDAWNATLLDRFPDGPLGGMCDLPPEIQSARVFGADGVTPVPGKPALVQGVDYTLTFTPAPTCELELTLLSPASVIGAGERLVIAYRTRLDADSQDGQQLTNYVAATEWFNDVATNTERVGFTRQLTNGTPGVADHEDLHTVTVALFGYFFEKTVTNLTTGTSPARTAAPGDTLRYTLRLQATDVELSEIRFFDDLGELNAGTVFLPGSLTLVPGSVPPGADSSNTNPAGGTNGAGILDIRNIDVLPFNQVSVQFDIVVEPSLSDGIIITNQADLFSGPTKIADSDDPTVNGQSDPAVIGDEDPTQLIVQAVPAPLPTKATTQPTATIGEEFDYVITVPSTPHSAPLYDVRILDNLDASAADLQIVAITKGSPEAWTPVNTGTPTNLVIEDPVNGIDVPAGEQIVIVVTVKLADTPTNVAGLTFTNAIDYTYNLIDNNDASQRPGGSAVSGPMTIVEPTLTLEKSGPPQLTIGTIGTFSLDVHNAGGSPAYGVTLTDLFPNQPQAGMCDVPPAQITAQLFEADGVTPVSAPLVEGVDFSASFDPDPACTLTISLLTASTAIGADQRLIVTYQAELDADTADEVVLTNIAGATTWFSLDPSVIGGTPRSYTPPLTDGTVGVLDHEDAHSLLVFLAVFRFEKTVANLTRAEDPGVLATPGDMLRYTLVIENLLDSDVNDFTIVDELDELNATPGFAPGSLSIVSAPLTSDTTNTSGTGGSSGTGILDIRGLNLSGLGDTIVIEFDAQLAPVIADGTVVLNQADLNVLGITVAQSDDPNVNGAADPDLFGDEDPTPITIESAPYFDVDKISAYVTGDPTVLLAGETLRYTITVKNVGTDHATDAVLRDLVPANTTYVAGSTSLNGNAIADPSAGVSPLEAGIAIYAPENATPGAMRADASATTSNVATIVFDVVVDPNLVDGSVISNQGFVSAIDGGVVDTPSDDPRTPIVDDPTRDIVGALPLIYAEKSAALEIDLGSQGVVDAGDTLRYTITVYNNGSVDATGVMLTDAVPANTSYVLDSTTLNAIAVPDGGAFPLIGSLPISSSDLTPPLPGAGEGTLSPGQAATIQFDLLVDATAVPGTLIVNQATVDSVERAPVLTDGDGNPATGPEPTVVVVGDVQQLAISKQVAVVGGGTAVAGATLEYTVLVRNISPLDATYVVITDDLDLPVAGQLAYVAQSATLNGADVGITVNGSLLTADYSTDYGPLPPDGEIVFRFLAVLDQNLSIGTTVVNTADVTWNDPPQTASASVTVTVGGIVGSGVMTGSAWHDIDFDNVRDGGEPELAGWSVELLRNGASIFTTLTDVTGGYRIAGVPPNYLTMDRYELRFTAPGAGPNTALLGLADSQFTNYLQRIDQIVVQSGSVLADLNLPIDPNGVIYDVMSRAPIAGAVLTLSDANGAPLPSACFDDPAQQDQITLAGGQYKFDLNFSQAACPNGGDYLIGVVPPSATYVPGYSQIIPPTASPTGGALSVPGCFGTGADAVPATLDHCEAQPSAFAPATGVAARSAGTAYYVLLTLDDSQPPGSAQIFNNHIPLDPELADSVSITKATPLLTVTRGQLVPYLITVTNDAGFQLADVSIVDRFPAGFRYVQGSARLDGEPAEPTVDGRELVWSDLGLLDAGRHSLELLLAVGAGVSEGDFVNRAQVMHNLTGNALSGEATATVRLMPDPDFDCTDVMGKVFDDVNRNGLQEAEESGIPGVRVVTATGLSATTDGYGRFHITCATIPWEGRGSNFVLKLDDRTLPSGYRSSIQPVRIERATRGKTLRVNFGASIHRVVGLDISDPVFVPGETGLRTQWQPRLELLLEELRKAPSILRLSYLADVEEPRLVNDRVRAVKDAVLEQWEQNGEPYPLHIESETFWRLGEPPPQPSRERVKRQ